MKHLLLLLALLLCVPLAAPASADAFSASQNALAAVQLADAYSISRMAWKGAVGWDRVAPECGRTAVREFTCQAIAIAAIRALEKPTKGTTIVNYVAAVAYSWYIHKAVSATILSVRF